MLLPASRTTCDVIRPAMEKLGVHVEIAEADQAVIPTASAAEAADLHGLNVHLQPEEHTGQAFVTAIVADSLKSNRNRKR